jgi:hypothetical protein
LLVILEEHADVYGALFVNLVLDEVLAIVVVVNLAGNLNTLGGLDVHLENVATRFTVLVLVVTSLNNKLNGLANGLVFQNTGAKGKRLVGTGVKEVGVAYGGSGKFATEDRKLHSALLGSKALEVGGDCGHFSFTNELARYVESVLTRSIDKGVANGEVDLDGLVFEALTLNSDWDTAGKLTQGRVNLSNGVRWTDDLVYGEGVHVVKPAVVPAAKDKEARVLVIVGGTSVLTSNRHDRGAFWLNLGPVHGADIEVVGAVDVGAEGTGLTFVKVGGLTTEDEVLPGGNSLNHNGGVVPASNLVVDIRVGPLSSVHVPDDQVVVLGLRVPATIRVKLIVESKQGVTATAFGHGGLSGNRLMLFPGLSLNVERVDVAEGNTSVVQTSVDPELALPHAGTGVGTRWGSANGGLLVDGDSLIASNARPRVVRDFEPPRIVQTLGGGGVATVDEDTVVLGGGQRDVLGAGWWDLVASAFLLLPSCLL